MKAIESCLNNLPVLHCLSGKPLPKKDLPFSYVKSRSKIAGTIYKEDRLKQKKPNNWWLGDMDIQILCAFLLQDQSANQFVHVISPTMTKLMQEVYEEQIKIGGMEEPTQQEKLHYQEQLQCLQIC